MAKADNVKEITGFTIGGVSPVGHVKKIEILIDDNLCRFNDLYAAAGHPNCVFKINFKNLVSFCPNDNNQKNIIKEIINEHIPKVTFV